MALLKTQFKGLCYLHFYKFQEKYTLSNHSNHLTILITSLVLYVSHAGLEQQPNIFGNDLKNNNDMFKCI